MIKQALSIQILINMLSIKILCYYASLPMKHNCYHDFQL